MKAPIAEPGCAVLWLTLTAEPQALLSDLQRLPRGAQSPLPAAAAGPSFPHTALSSSPELPVCLWCTDPAGPSRGDLARPEERGGSQPRSPLAPLGSLHPHIHPQGPLPQDPDTSGAEAPNPS